MIGHILQRAAEGIYGILENSRLAYLYFPKVVRKDLQKLDKNEKSYYIKKIQCTCGLLFVGAMLAIFYIVTFVLSGNEKVEVLERPEAYQETRQVMLQVGEGEMSYAIEVAPVVLTLEEAEAQFKEVVIILKEYILGNNVSLDAITEDLILPDHLEGYPFQLYWESDCDEVIDTFGTVCREGITEDTIVILTVECSYEEWMWKEQFGVLVLKENLSKEALYKRELEQFLKEEERIKREENVWELPKEFEGERLQYHRVDTDDTMLWLAILIAVTGIGIWFMQDYDLRTDRRKRQEIFRREYPALVNSLSLYISAGQTLQKAVLFCVRDYERRKSGEHLLRVALEEFHKDLENGYSFSVAIEKFSEFCDDANYKKLAGLLTQGVRNGAQGLSELLEKEAEQVNEEKRRWSKVKGEQVSTALIAPMMLQLGIVIALIMIPAFSGLQF